MPNSALIWAIDTFRFIKYKTVIHRAGGPVMNSLMTTTENSVSYVVEKGLTTLTFVMLTMDLMRVFAIFDNISR